MGSLLWLAAFLAALCVFSIILEIIDTKEAKKWRENLKEISPEKDPKKTINQR